jgi:hypothetical protein
MQLECTRCRHLLEYTAEPPAFCSRCGYALTETLLTETLSTLPPLPTPATAPLTIGGYRLLRPLGEGGMGTVYEAEDSRTHRRVALKLISPEFAEHVEMVERFRREGRLASLIAHPRCVFVYAADEEAGRPYIVMELMPGKTLEDVVAREGRLPVRKAVVGILDVIDGLSEAHRLGFVHRDVKPGNCFVDAQGHIKVGDFGLVRSLLGDARLTRTGSFVGTPLFASPEQVKGEEVDARSDIYSAAATLYYLLAGRAPFQSSDAAAALARIASEEAPPLDRLRPELPAALVRVVQRGLARDRRERWQTLEEFRTALLPFGPAPPAAETFALRVGAFIIDWLTLWPLQALASMIILTDMYAEAGWFSWPLGMIDTAGAMVYFAVMEGLWGWSLGKRLMGLRVGRDQAGTPPGLLRASVRVLVLLAGSIFASAALGVFLEASSDLDMRQRSVALLLCAAAAGLGYVAWWGVLASTMRRRNGYRGLHEWLSGTCLLRRVGPEPILPLVGPFPAAHPVPADGLPQTLGPYQVHGRLAGTEDLLLGADPALGRTVLLWLRPAEAPAVAAARQHVARTSRLRWLAAGSHQGRQWDAFLAPAGRPFAGLVKQTGRFTWSHSRPVLLQLAEELSAACDDGTLPDVLTPEQVWADRGGRVQLLDWSTQQAPANPEDAPARAVALLAQVAVLLLEGQPRPEGGAPRVPVPLHVGKLLRWLSGEWPYAHPREFHAELAATADRAREVSRPRRAAQLAVLGVCLVMPLELMLILNLMFTLMGMTNLAQRIVANEWALESVQIDDAQRTIKYETKYVTNGRRYPSVSITHKVATREALELWAAPIRLKQQRRRQQLEHDLQEYEARRKTLGFMQMLSPFDQQPRSNVHFWQGEVDWANQYAAEDYYSAEEFVMIFDHPPRVRVEAAALPPEAAVKLAAWWLSWCPVVCVVMTFLFRGGLIYWLLGLALARADGRPAGRLRCAWRTLLAWAPVTVLLFVSAWLLVDYWHTWDAGEPDRWQFWLSSVCWWAAVVLLVTYPVLALAFPRRTLHDWLAGTYVVPR